MKKILTIAAVGTLLAVTGCGKAENAGGAVKREAPPPKGGTVQVIVTVEEGSIGGLGAHVLTFASDEGLTDNGLKVRTLRLPDTFIDHEDPMKQYDEAGLNAPQIVDTVLKALKHNSTGVDAGEEVRA